MPYLMIRVRSHALVQVPAREIRDHIDQDPDLKQQSTLLESIPGIGKATAAQLLCELGDWSRFGSAREAAACVGLVPGIRESGTSVRARSSLCKLGNSRLRKALYLPAMSALRHNRVIRAMASRLSASGKSKMSILGAAMRRLVHLAYGVLKSGKAFLVNPSSRELVSKRVPRATRRERAVGSVSVGRIFGQVP